MAAGWQGPAVPGSVNDTCRVVADSIIIDAASNRSPAPVREFASSFQDSEHEADWLGWRTKRCRMRSRAIVSGPPRATSARAGSSTADTSCSQASR